MQRIQQRRRRLCHSTRRCLLFSAVVFILIGIHRHHEGVEGAEIATNHGCPVTQFRCSTTGRCVNLNVFCDGRNDCGDNSDEPAQCTHCNRTYYAGIGESYRLLVAWPKLNQMPFLCYLTFMSATQEPPQLLQVRVDTATIGQYVVQQSKDEVNGRCPEGCMQILEGEMQLNQPKVAPSALNNGGTTNTSSGGWPGAWCGASITPRFYYADSKSVTFALHLQTIPQSLLQKSKSLLIAGDTLSSSSITAQQLHPILDLTYKILPRSSAVLRYGGSGGKGSNMNQLGEPVAGTACSRLFRQCGILSGTTANDNDQEECRVQSPGYPGIYPRNAHCLYRISSHRPGAASPASANAGRHVVALWQNDGRKINLRDWNQPTRDAGHSQRTSRSTAECEASGDYITIYDGVNTLAPVLARFCDGPLPQVVSSSADVTVEFRSSPLDTIYAGWTAIEGFELKVRIMAAENLQPVISSASEIGRSTVTGTSSSSSNNNNNKCQWNVTSSGLSRGQLHSPAQTWPLRTMCHFRFVGRADERVWIYFAKYHFEKENSKRRQQQHQCRNALRIAEGDGSGWDPSTANSSAVGNGTIRLFCRDTRPPPLCERQLPVVANARGSDRWTTTPPPLPPPCLAGESFLSNGSTLSVQQHLPEGTAFSPWKYVLVYEFFRPHQDGQPLLDVGGSERPINCNRLFSVGRNQSSDGGAVELRGSVKSPQNVFLFGRGGARHLKCVYRFQGDETMRVAIEVTRLRLGGHPGTRCRNRLDPLTHQRRCHMLRSTAIHSSPKDNKNNKNNNNGSSSSTAFLQLRERPWAGQAAGHQILLQRDCLCDTSGLQLPFRYVSTSSAVEVVFNVNGMTHADDYHDFFFEISYEFLGGPAAAAGSSAGSNSHLKCASQSELKPLQGPGGIIKLDGLRGSGLTTSRQNSVCNRQSWLLLPRADRFLFLSTTGFVMNNQLDDAARDKQEQEQEQEEEEEKEKEGKEEEESYSSDSIDCSTKNRVVVYSAGQVGGEPLAIICPSARSNRRPDGGVKIFSPTFEDDLAGERQDLEDDDEWRLGTQSALSTGGVVIEFIAIQSGSYTLKWLELTPQSLLAVNPFNNKSFRAIPHLGSVSSSPPQQAPAWFFCSTWCPELKACIDSQLWCDGVYDCPSGVDESDQQCHSTGSSDDDDNNNNNMSPTDNEPPTRISAWNVPKVYWYLIAAGSTLLSLFIVVSSVLVCRENGHHHFKQPEVVAGLSSPANISQSSQGSFPPAPVTALNDYVYPPDNVVSGVANVKIVVGGTKTESVDKVSSLYHYDKKMAVS